MTRNEQIRAAAEQALKDCPYINTSLIGFDFFVKGAMWADETMIEWVCKWLDENLERYIFDGRNGKPYISIVLCDDLRNAMNSDNH